MKTALGTLLIVISFYFLFYTIWTFNTIGEIGNSSIIVSIITVVLTIIFFITGIYFIRKSFNLKK